MAIGLVQQVTGANGGFVNTLSIGITAPAPGNCLVLCFVTTTDAAITISSVTGGGVTWTKAAQSNTHADCEIWVGPNSSGVGTTITITMTSNTAGLYANFTEWSGIVTSSPQDGSGSPNTGDNTSPTSSLLTTTNAVDLIIAVAGNTGGASTTAGPTNSFTALQTPLATVAAEAYLIVSATGSYSTGWTYSGAVFWDVAIAAFKGAAATENMPWNRAEIVEEIIDIVI